MTWLHFDLFSPLVALSKLTEVPFHQVDLPSTLHRVLHTFKASRHKSSAFVRASTASMPSVKPTLPLLKTPKSASFPSELPRSPLPGGQTELVKREDDMKTPITPPTAYTDFLKALSSPSIASITSPIVGEKSDKSSPTSNTSSTSSGCSCNCEHRESPKFVVPPSPYARPHPQSAPATGPLRRLRIPQSPLCSPGADSPMSARSMRSPFGIRSPNEWDLTAKFGSFDAPTVRTTRPVSVRQVVTRTVTYTPRMDLAPAPKGKKRRIE